MMTHYDLIVKRILDKNREKIKKTSISRFIHQRPTKRFLSDFVQKALGVILRSKIALRSFTEKRQLTLKNKKISKTEKTADFKFF